VERFDFLNSIEAMSKLKEKFGFFNSEPYFTDHFKGMEKTGICIAYTVKVLERVQYNKPDLVKIPQLGWIKVNDQTAREWFGKK
jgi:hypothetical protein